MLQAGYMRASPVVGKYEGVGCTIDNNNNNSNNNNNNIDIKDNIMMIIIITITIICTQGLKLRLLCFRTTSEKAVFAAMRQSSGSR